MSKVIRRKEAPPAHRGAMTTARKRRIHEQGGGLCQACGTPVPVLGPKVQYDHRICLELGGADEDHNLDALCTRPCHAEKTKRDQAAIAKARRLRKKAEAELNPGKIASRPFQSSGGKQKIASRPFQKRKKPASA